MAAQLQAAMFQEAAKIGGLDVQLVYYRGTDEVRYSPWTTDANELAGAMTKIFCRGRHDPDRENPRAHARRA